MEFEIAGQNYRVGKLDPFKQLHITRRLVPVLSGLVEIQDKTFADFIQPIADSIAHMPDTDCDFILQTCLSVVQRQQGNAWVGVYAPNTKALMFDDIDLTGMIQITVKVIQENLGSFFSGGVASLTQAAPATS